MCLLAYIEFDHDQPTQVFYDLISIIFPNYIVKLDPKRKHGRNTKVAILSWKTLSETVNKPEKSFRKPTITPYTF